MKPGDRTQIPTVADAVGDAAALVDPGGDDPGVVAMIEAYEDDTRPTTAVEDLIGELRSTARAIAPEGDDPPVEMTAAAASWLATNPDHAGDRERVLTEGARLYFEGSPPEPVAGWLEAQGVSA